MRFLAPLFLAGAALIALPIALHLLRRDVAPQVPFPAVRLLRGAPVDRSRNLRLRDVLLLAARVTALLLLAASFARPYRVGASAAAPLTIVAIDRSFSMGAPGRFQRALDLARAEIDRAAAGRVALVAFDDHADVAAAPGLASDARAALAALRPGAGSTRYAPMFDRASELTGGLAGGRLVVVSDLQRSGFEGSRPSLAEGIDLQVRDAGGVSANVAIEDLEVRDGRARVTIRNYGASTVHTTLRVGAASNPAFTRPIEIAGKTVLQVAVDRVAPGAVAATVADPGGYAADNERFAIAEARHLPRILVVSGAPGSSSGFYLEHALLAGGNAGADFDVVGLTGSEFAALQPADVARAASVVLLSTHAIHRRAGDAFKALFAAGGGVFVAAGPDVDPSVLSNLLGIEPALAADEDSRRGVLAVSDVRHPVFRPFDGLSANLAQIGFDREWRVGADPSWTTVATFSTGAPALLERAAGNGRVLLFASDVDRRWNDFPLHATFVPFVQEAIRYVGARPIADGALLVADVPDGVPATPGVATLHGRLRAVNVDTRESSTDRLAPGDFAAAVARTNTVRPATGNRLAREREAAQALWRYGLGLMFVTLVLEAFVGAR